jgi:hypothetical protein
MKTDIGHFDASQNFEEMGTEFTLSLRFYENIVILPSKILKDLLIKDFYFFTYDVTLYIYPNIEFLH